MNPKRYLFSTTLALATIAFASVASATPAANSAVVIPRVYNDCNGSSLTVIDNNFASVIIDDAAAGCSGGANRHAWSLSTDNINAVDFLNGDQFSFCATVLVSGSGNGEAGLRLSPWWSLENDGVFMLNTFSGEIACFGGRLPFYSFTGAHLQTYVKGTSVTLAIDYKPNGLSAASPGTIVYTLTNSNGTFSSGPLAFDEGNPTQDPPRGLWGILNPANAGGYMQIPWGGQGPTINLRTEWSNICYDASPVPAAASTWGKIKADYR